MWQPVILYATCVEGVVWWYSVRLGIKRIGIMSSMGQVLLSDCHLQSSFCICNKDIIITIIIIIITGWAVSQSSPVGHHSQIIGINCTWLLY